jgi:electron-transferring-flavoprotein dehydrogenase
MGVEIYPGFAASEVVYDGAGAVKGVATRDQGIGKDGTPGASFERGVEIHGRQTVFAEGARGSCSEAVMERFNLREGVQDQTFGLGVKEVWEVPEATAQPGYVQHTLGWPLQEHPFSKTFGGSFLYHMAPNYVLVGFVVGLDYENPNLSPYQEFQRWKHHPEVSRHLEGGKCVQYGARVLNEGGYHAIPKLTFPGGMLTGCSAGFLNAVKIKGSHTALKSGMVAGEAIYDALQANGATPVFETYEIPEGPAEEVSAYATAMEGSWVYDELKEVRNCHASFHWGTLPGMIYTALATFFTKGKEPWTLPNAVKDSNKTGLAAEAKPIDYPAPDGKLSFSLLNNLTLSGTNNEGYVHLKVKADKANIPEAVSLQVYGGPEQHFCPAGVYTYDENDKLNIANGNCLHCKACAIKTPHEYIDWTVPEGGYGPKYDLM